MMQSFTFQTSATVEFGDGLLGQSGARLAALLGKTILIVTDPGIVALGFVERLQNALTAAGSVVEVYNNVVADPPEAVVQGATDMASEVSGVIGLGGGSSLDVAKLVAILAMGHQPLSEVYGVGKVKGARLPLALIPTTAGTGSEVTPVAIVTTGAQEKMGVVAPQLIPDLALLDPELTHGLPAPITAATGIDAMVHAIEAYASASPNNNPISRLLAKEALRLMGAALERAVHDGSDRAARADMLLGSMMAGQAFANAPVAAVHALAYPIGGHFKIPHGLSNALILPNVLRFNAATHPQPYNALAPYAFPNLSGLDDQSGAKGFADALEALARRCALPPRLRDVGIPEDALGMMARDAMNQTRLLVNNPRPVTEEDAQAIYRAAW